MNIVSVTNADDLAAVRDLWREYWATLGLPRGFQEFEEELRGLPGKYAPPRGCILLARVESEPAAAIALRPLREDSCEAKRLYVRPKFRRRGIASALLARLIDEARTRGYRTLFADTLPSMASAQTLYLQKTGFIEVGPYSNDPTPGAVYFRKNLLV